LPDKLIVVAGKQAADYPGILGRKDFHQPAPVK
jgi:hypothetical protein